jgi:hypothetical protein
MISYWGDGSETEEGVQSAGDGSERGDDRMRRCLTDQSLEKGWQEGKGGKWQSKLKVHRLGG